MSTKMRRKREHGYSRASASSQEHHKRFGCIYSIAKLLLATAISSMLIWATKANECHASDNNSCLNKDTINPQVPDYLIIGAGGAGIQTALLLQKYGHTFRIFEKASTAGSFWTTFPRFHELISVNKQVRNETQRFRYDWHSFLESHVGMRNVSTAYYPTGKEWHQYMNAVVEYAGIDVEYGMEVESLDDTGRPCVRMKDNGGEKNAMICAKYRVFVGTGLQEKDERYLRAIGGVRYSDVTLEMARGKRVCIFGNGNAGFETAQNMLTVADRVIVIGKRPTRLSAVTKYTGDVRVKFLTALENFHGKLLDTVVHDNMEERWLEMLNTPGTWMNNFRKDWPGSKSQLRELAKILDATSYVGQYECELMVLATGFRSSIPGKRLNKRFPSYGRYYAASENPTISYIGWLGHKDDFQKGAGGFLSGYRYLIRNLIHHVREMDHGVPYPYLVLNKQQALEHAVHRIQVADDLVVLQDGVVVRDAIVPMGNGEYHYYEGITYKYFEEFEQREDIIYLYFAWGDGRGAATVFDNVYGYNDTLKLRNIYLHPLIEVNAMVREAEEDLDMAWKTAQFVPPIKRIVRDALREDYSKFYPKPSYPYKPYEVSTEENHAPFEEGSSLPQVNAGNLIKVAAGAILAGGTTNALRALRAEAKNAMPSLIFPQKQTTDREYGGDSDTNCATAGSACAGMSCCGNSTSCVYISDFDASFCLDV